MEQRLNQINEEIKALFTILRDFRTLGIERLEERNILNSLFEELQVEQKTIMKNLRNLDKSL